MKYQVFLPHFGSMGEWLEGSWDWWMGVAVGGGGVGGVFVRDGLVCGVVGCVVGWVSGVVVGSGLVGWWGGGVLAWVGVR